MFLPIWAIVVLVILAVCFNEQIKGFLAFLAGLSLLVGLLALAWVLLA